MNLETILAKTDEIAAGVVAANAGRVDADGAFPQASVDALAAAGLLGLVSAEEVGGLGQAHRAAALVVERLARECASTAMVACMHFAGTAVLEAHGSLEVRRGAAAGKHLSTLAFSEVGSRSAFWAPVGTATAVAGGVQLDGQKSFVTSAHHATAYIWSSKPMTGPEASSLWLVPADAAGLDKSATFDGFGLRGNDSAAVNGSGVVVPVENRLGTCGGGFGIMMATVLPLFNAMSAGVSVGLMESAVSRSGAHAAATRHTHAGTSLAELPAIRAYIARMAIQKDMARALLLDTLDALEKGRPDAMLRVLQCKAAAAEAALEVVNTAMRVCGGAAFRKDGGIERLARDARAAAVMAPTSDQLFDFIGKALCGLPLF